MNRSTSLARPAAARRRRFAALLCGAALLAVGPQAFAERADKDKPAVISADKLNGDDVNQTSVYTGDVVLTKGTIALRADQLTTKQDPEGYNFGTAIVTKPNRLVYFRQKREGVDEFIEGQAEKIEYDEKTDTVRLFNRAVVKRLAAGRDADEIRGDRIDYNSRTEVYNAESAASPSTPQAGQPAGNGRVRVVLQPKVKATGTGTGNAAKGAPLPLKTDPSLDGKSSP